MSRKTRGLRHGSAARVPPSRPLSQLLSSLLSLLTVNRSRGNARGCASRHCRGESSRGLTGYLYGRSPALPRGPNNIRICCALWALAHKSLLGMQIRICSIALQSQPAKQCSVPMSVLPDDQHPSQCLGSAVLPRSSQQVHSC